MRRISDLTGRITGASDKKHWFLFCCLVLVMVFALQGASLNDQFLSDDHDWIRGARLRVESGEWLGAFNASTGGNFYRPIVALSFEVDYSIWKHNPVGYHLHQTVVHAALVIALAYLLWLITKNKPVAFATALLFAVYPAQHEVVTWLAGRPDLYAAAFSVISLAAFLSFLEKRAWWKFLISLITAALALLSKETAFVLPALFLLGSLFTGQSNPRKHWYSYFIWILPASALLVLVLLIRNSILSDAIGGYLLAGDRQGLIFQLVNLKRIFTSMLYLVNWEQVSSLFGDSGSVYWGKWLFHALVKFWAMTLGLAAVISAVLILKDKRRLGHFIFGAAWSIAGFIPVFGLSGFIAENLTASRLFFFSSIGYCIIIASLILPYANTKRTHLRYFVFSGIFLIFGSLWIFNYLPWQTASIKSAIIKVALKTQRNELLENSPTDVYIGRIPSLYNGAYIFFGTASIKESMYAVTKNDSPRTFLVGDLPYKDSGLCLPTDSRTIAYFNWDEEKSEFVPGHSSIRKKLNDTERVPAQAKVWDFSDPAVSTNWEFQNIRSEQKEAGVELTIGPGEERFLQSPKFDEVFLGDYKSVTLVFDVLEPPTANGQYAATIGWAVRGAFPGNSLEYTLDKQSTQNVTIPICQYPNWALSPHVDQLRFLPMQSGTLLLKKISVQ